MKIYCVPFIPLQAICLLIKERFSKEGMERFNKTGTPKLKDIIPLDKVELGFVAGGKYKKKILQS